MSKDKDKPWHERADSWAFIFFITTWIAIGMWFSAHKELERERSKVYELCRIIDCDRLR